MSQDDPIVIVSIARTPIGNFQGSLKNFSGHQLGSYAIKAAVERASLKADDVDEVIMGCVLPAGQGQAPARQAAIHAGIPASTPCTTINKVCGSGMKAVMFAHDLLAQHSADVVIAGGMESMTNAPYLLKKARQGYRLGHSEIFDHMMLDGLEDAYENKAMGVYAEQCASQFNFTRKQQDDYSLMSFERARHAVTDGAFKNEIAPITVKTKQGEEIIAQDERPLSIPLEKISTLSPVFAKEGTVTAGNSSSIADGAAALVLMRASEAEKRGIKPLARIVAFASSAKAPSEFTTAPIDATIALLKKANLNISDIDLFEVNEAFAVVSLAFMQALKVPSAKLNVNGGAVALGHPIGATGARILVSLISALQQKNLKRGLATLCIGGGEATAIVVERL